MIEWNQIKDQIQNTPTNLGKEAVRDFSNEDAIRVYLWDQKGVVPDGLSKKDISALYSKSNIVCLPSYREGLPKALAEAAAASRAIVTTDAAGCRDAIIPNKSGLLVPLKNAKKLADAINWLLDNPKERIAMGKAGRELAEREFGIEKIIQGHLNIYKKDLLKQ